MRNPSNLVVLVLALVAAGCSSLAPLVPPDGDADAGPETIAGGRAVAAEGLQLRLERSLVAATVADKVRLRQDVQPITGVLTLDEALARALKYNLDRRARMMEEALALNQLEASRHDMLPRLIAQAGYSSRDNDLISQSRSAEDGSLSPSRFISRERNHALFDLGFTWNALDFGLGYFGVRQQANRLLIAGEKRRKAMHLLMQDVRTAYWRAATAQKIGGDLRKAIAMAESSLADAVKIEQSRVRSPLEAMRYQRQMLENLRLLEAIEQELSSAQVDLAGLINAPLGQSIVVADMNPVLQTPAALQLSIEKLEEAALAQNPDLREQHLNAALAAEEVRKTMLRLFPNISFSYGLKYDTDRYLVNRDWREAGLQISYNLLNLFTGPAQIDLAKAGVSLAEQRRLAMHMAVLTQVHLARQQLASASAQYARAAAIEDVDRRIAQQVGNREAVEMGSKLERVSADTSAILSQLRRYQAAAQVQAAENRLLATVGMEPRVGSTGELSLAQIVEQVRQQGDPWTTLK